MHRTHTTYAPHAHRNPLTSTPHPLTIPVPATSSRTQSIMTQPTQAQIFSDFMRAVWDDNIEDPAGNSKYDLYENANDVATILGAKPTGQKSHYGDPNDNWNEYLFPDGSTTWINLPGNGTLNASQ